MTTEVTDPSERKPDLAKTSPEPPQDTSLDDKATQHTHKWCHVSKAWEHCSVCDKWRSTSDAK